MVEWALRGSEKRRRKSTGELLGYECGSERRAIQERVKRRRKQCDVMPFDYTLLSYVLIEQLKQENNNSVMLIKDRFERQSFPAKIYF